MSKRHAAMTSLDTAVSYLDKALDWMRCAGGACYLAGRFEGVPQSRDLVGAVGAALDATLAARTAIEAAQQPSADSGATA